jgi:cell division protein ZipA
MDNYLRLGLLLIAGTILFLILLEAWHRRRYLKMMQFLDDSKPHPLSSENHSTPEHKDPIIQTDNTAQNDVSNPLIMLSVLAKPNCTFGSYDLVQSILATGLQFGEGNLFHFYQENADKTKLFSLAAATKSGEFDLDHIGDFSCKGLILFLDLDTVIESTKAFEKMLSVAEQLADDLDGELRADPRTPWSNEILKQYQQKVLQHRIVA